MQISSSHSQSALRSILSLSLLIVLFPFGSFGQSQLTIEKIMQDPGWIGTSPSGLFWSANSDTLYFMWNPEKAPSDSLYFITGNNHKPQKASATIKQHVVTPRSLVYNSDRTAFVFSKDGDIFYQKTTIDTYSNRLSGKKIQNKNSQIINGLIRVTQTDEAEYNPRFTNDNKAIAFQKGSDLYIWDIATGITRQMVKFVNSPDKKDLLDRSAFDSKENGKDGTPVEQWLANEQTQYMQVLKERQEKQNAADQYRKAVARIGIPRLNNHNMSVSNVSVSPNGRYVSYKLNRPAAKSKQTIVPDYITNSGYTTDIPGRKKVGEPQGTNTLFVYQSDADSVFKIATDQLSGIRDIPEFYKDYPAVYDSLLKADQSKDVRFGYNTIWSPNGRYLLTDVWSLDNKDRWIIIWDAEKKQQVEAYHDHDEAWIGGPGVYSLGWTNDRTIYFQSEATGFSHIYLYDVDKKSTKQLTKGDYEVQSATLSPDKSRFFITTNEVDPGEQQFYVLDIQSGKKQRITTMTGANEVTVSPDGNQLGILYSYTNKPWELYLQPNKKDSKAEQITDKAMSDEWKSYPWRDPELVYFQARDGAEVRARVFKPKNYHPGMPAVVFVHGAGYLQNAHKWWSLYFRENMFHNFLADNGYFVIDADYRGSAGYGRDWRTGIYRHMGGKDLDDVVDAAQYLVKEYGVDQQKIGIYGGSYGGFITLMAMFTTPDVFAAGAGLRSVTEWANYNHGYTSNILNEPTNDSIAYKRSSPIYFADGLKGHLLMCHGMVDQNVHFQDIVKLTQRLIELKKDHWELAVYPMEDHGFVEPTSWMDEYKRIFNLFETNLK